ncbi:MAG: ribosome maturation factor RimM [Clostridiales bacterium]|nr:ribosome maturation factor RimM [Clostridiales bacterium]
MDYYRIGLFLRPHGVRGEIKLLPLTDDISRFKKLDEAFIEAAPGCYRSTRVVGTKIAAENSVIVQLEGVSTMDAAELYRNKYLCVDRDHAVALPEGSYFISDIIGCRVVSTAGEELGVVEDVYETTANDVYVVRGEKKLSVPALKKLLVSVDVRERLIVFDADVLSEVGLFED